MTFGDDTIYTCGNSSYRYFAFYETYPGTLDERMIYRDCVILRERIEEKILVGNFLSNEL